MKENEQASLDYAILFIIKYVLCAARTEESFNHVEFTFSLKSYSWTILI